MMNLDPSTHFANEVDTNEQENELDEFRNIEAEVQKEQQSFQYTDGEEFEGSDEDFEGTQVFQSNKLRMSKEEIEFEGDEEGVEIRSESQQEEDD